MKLVSILLTIFSLHVSAAGGKAQTVSLSLQNEPIQKFFDEIKRQTGYVFVYKEDFIKLAKPVTINVKNEKLETVLQDCFKTQPFNYSLVDRYIVIHPKEPDSNPTSENNLAVSDEINIKGRVLNEGGVPVHGVTVTVRGTTISTITDSEGQFVLETIDKDAILVFTHVSMETFEVKVSGKTELVVNLKTKVTALGDVIVTVSTGYEDIPKERATGSFAKIDNKVLNQQVGTNILKRIEGVTAGVLFDNNKLIGGGPRNDVITIRGLSTINASLEPLIVLDGFIYEGNINNINPNNIESITILKDAAATSIWGARAGNGVIVLTSKKGQFNQKLQIGFNANVIINEKPDLYYLPQMSSSDYIGVEEFLFNNGFGFNGAIYNSYQALSPAVDVFLKRQNGLISAADSTAQINALRSIDIRDQYNKYVYENAVTQQYAINLRGGNNNNAYTFSIGYDKNLDETKGNFKKLNINVENIYKPVKDFQAMLRVYYTNSDAQSGIPAYNSISVAGRNIPYLSLADENGTPLSIATLYRNDYVDTAGSGKLLDWKFYPLEDYKHSLNTTKTQELFATIGLQYKLTQSLNIDLKWQYQKQEIQAEGLFDSESFYARNLINTFSQLDPTNGVVSYIVPKGGIRNVNNSSVESSTARGQFNFNHNWGNHKVAAVLGSEIRQVKASSDFFSAYGYNADPLTTTSVDFRNAYPTFITGNFEGIPGTPSFGKTANRFVSGYANATYVFKDRYILSASGRRDGSNIFGVNTNDKWKPLWSVGSAWKISDELFYKIKFLPILKLRLTYGYSGNVDLTKSAAAVGSYSTSSVTNLPFTRINTPNNPDLRWEKSGMLNLGIDFASEKSVITGSIEYYVKNGRDLYGLSPIDYTTWGASSLVIKNVANMKGKGIDIVLNSNIVDKTFKWNAGIIFNYNTSKVTKYFGDNSKDITLKLNSGRSISPVVGKPLYAIAAYKWGGLDASGNPQGYVDGALSTNYRGIINEGIAKGVDGNIIYIGSATPTIFGSVINGISWKMFTISANISYKFGYYFRKSVFTSVGLINGSGHKDFEKRWQKPGDETTTNVPAFVYPNTSNNTRRDNFYLNSEVNILKADHIRFQYVNLSYSWEKGSRMRLPFKDIQLYLNASNLGILWKANKEGLDPEYPTSLRPTRAFAFGIRGNF